MPFSVCRLYMAALMVLIAAPAHAGSASPQAGSASPQNVGSVSFVEGPASRPDGTVLFTDIPNNRIMQWKKGTAPKIYRSPSGYANGLFFDRDGRLVIAETQGRLVRERPDGAVDVLADSFNGAPFNSLNDLALDTNGRIYFTDPAYRDRKNARQRDANGEIIDGVYRFDPSGKLSRVLKHEISMPNGVIVSPDDRFLYVAENSNQPGGARKLWQFELYRNGNVKKRSKKMLYDWGTDRGPDGLAIDVAGNIYAAAGLHHPRPNRTSVLHKGGIYVISPEGGLVNFIPVPMDVVSNVTFGGDDMKTLFITAGHSLWTFQNDIAGYIPFR